MAQPSSASKRIVLGVSGGTAAYKGAELVRLLSGSYRVQVIMTRAAQEFIRPLTFAALTGEKVITDLFSEASGEATLQSAIEHIGVAQQADLLLVAPATAGILAKFAHGAADDFLTTTHLAFRGPLVLAPAMNSNMWEHPATRANMETLRARGARIVTPDAGELACGMVGPGRLADLTKIVRAVEEAFAAGRSLAGETVLITAGPTREPLDPVRFLSNRSSGRMGFALAEEAASRGARVVLISGPVSLPDPPGCRVVRVETAEEMREAALERLPEATIAVLAAAVSDFAPARVESSKIKKERLGGTLDLTTTPDILAEAGRRKEGCLLIGFAAETGDVVQQGFEKLHKKNCDLLVANPVGPAADGTGFDSSENQGWLLAASGETIELPRSGKREMAARIFEHALRLRQERTAARTPASPPA